MRSFDIRAHGTNHACTFKHGHLCRVMTHSSRRGNHQDSLTRQIAAATHCLKSRQARDSHARSRIKTGVVWQSNRLRLGQHDVLRTGAKGAPELTIPGPDPLTDSASRDPCADRVDHSSSITVRDNPRCVQCTTTTRFHIGGVDTRNANFDANFTRTHLGRRNLTKH